MPAQDLALTLTASLLAPINLSATNNGTGVDLLAYDGLALIVQNIGVATGTSPTLAGKIQSAPDNSTWTDVTNAVFVTVTASANLQYLLIDRNMRGRYIRHVATLGGTSPTFVTSVTVTVLQKVR